jgi:cysteine desulfurase
MSHPLTSLGPDMDLYLDYNATTPPDPEVVEAVLPYLGGQFNNAASAHARPKQRSIQLPNR